MRLACRRRSWLVPVPLLALSTAAVVEAQAVSAAVAPQATAERRDCPEGGGAFGVQIENDMPGLAFGAGTDEAYTSGTRVEFSGRGLDRQSKGPLGTLFPFAAKDNACFRYGFALALLLYTPNQIETAVVQANDRPYGAWLYGSYELTRFQGAFEGGTNRTDLFAIDLGILGPGAGGRWFQDTTHRVFGIESRVGQDYKRPLGWHHQLRNEVGFNVRYLRRQRILGTSSDADDRFWDLIAHGGGVAGNVFTSANVGTTGRLGFHIPNDLGPQLNIPAPPPPQPALPHASALPLPASQQPPPSPAPSIGPKRYRWSAYVFAGTEGRFILRNAFLDGNLFARDRRDRGIVQKEPLVADVSLGAVVVLGIVRVTYRNVLRSSEFKTPRGLPPGAVNNYRHRFGSIAVMIGM